MNIVSLRNKMKKNFLGYFCLLLCSYIYIFLVKLRIKMYEIGILSSKRVNTPVICFGNISAGGTGKTSMVITVARELFNLNKKVAIIMRGYKKQGFSRKVIFVNSENLSTEICGDEAKLIYLSLKDLKIPVIVSADRVKAAKFAIDNFHPDVILMDDGFQHLAIFRDLNVLLINTNDDIKEEILPLGNLREDFNAIKRADIVVLTHCESSSQSKIDSWYSVIREKNEKIPIIESIHSPDFFIDVLNSNKKDISFFKNKDVVILSGIGDPDSFEKNIKNLGANIKKIWTFPDHYNYTLSDIIAIENTRNNLPVITTYKDFVRFPENWNKVIKNDLYIFMVRINFLANGYKVLIDKIMDKFKDKN